MNTWNTDDMRTINSQKCEQIFSLLRRIATQVAYMKMENVFLNSRYFLACWNKEIANNIIEWTTCLIVYLWELYVWTTILLLYSTIVAREIFWNRCIGEIVALVMVPEFPDVILYDISDSIFCVSKFRWIAMTYTVDHIFVRIMDFASTFSSSNAREGSNYLCFDTLDHMGSHVSLNPCKIYTGSLPKAIAVTTAASKSPQTVQPSCCCIFGTSTSSCIELSAYNRASWVSIEVVVTPRNNESYKRTPLTLSQLEHNQWFFLLWCICTLKFSRFIFLKPKF